MFRKIFLLFLVVGFLGFANTALAHLPRIVTGDKVVVSNPEVSQAFYGELNGNPAEYTFTSDRLFDLYVNILVPEPSNPDGRYSVGIYRLVNGQDEIVATLPSDSIIWQEIWEEFGRDFYMKGPEFENKQEAAGDYRVVVSSADNKGKYVLAIGQKEQFIWQEILKVYYIVPLLKLNFFHSSLWQFLLTPFVLFGAMALVSIFIIIVWFIYLIQKAIKKSRPKSILD